MLGHVAFEFAKAAHILPAKIPLPIRIVNILTTNELVKLTTL